ncbi:hypothetical protein FGO68_gene14037 [Halteria grandinella]|uniref:Alpha-1,4 glucan phosphorylase n=1 Tax=Halteria grandinella TaxID=5974 RepID=A0A8J8P5J8_HALGN|nr:hypothetical protein FGO68_gene14037 [Halteria grandinella]
MLGDDKEVYRPEFANAALKVSEGTRENLWSLMNSYQGRDSRSIQRSIVNHVEYTLGLTRFNFKDFNAYQATSYSVRDRLIEQLNDSNEYFNSQNSKRVYYLSLEFLLGRMLQNSLVNIDMEKKYKDALTDIGFKLEEIYEEEVDPALGNGGLGRLAACFLDSMATLDIPAMGYGIRYDYGIFKQQIQDGYQVEQPDYWLAKGNPWEIERPDVAYPVRFGGTFTKSGSGCGVGRWEGGEVVMAIAYDTPVPGFNTYNTNRLRLWRSRPGNEFDLQKFNDGQYDKSIMERQRAEYITSVLYPNDSTWEGKQLRLKQQYFFCCATIQDIIKRFKLNNTNWNDFPKLNQIQLNDTHPAIAAIELLRVLLDVERLPYDQAWMIVTGTFGYTNHTVLPEALEKWSVNMLQSLLPRHMDLIFFINQIFLEEVKRRFPGDGRRLEVVSMIEGWEDKRVRMANVAIVCSHHVNGVAALHTQILKASVFKDFYEIFPDKFLNMTNGVTPRRWLYCCNPGLAQLISDTINNDDDWVTDMRMVEEIAAYADEQGFVDKFKQVKVDCKKQLQHYIEKTQGIHIRLDAMYDVLVKRIHEYKRQLMDILYIIHRYLQILGMNEEQRRNVVPRVVFIGGKAAPGYKDAKGFIKLINSVADRINNDKSINDLIKVVFFKNYCVSNAQIIIPAADLSQHISTAGTEASGTSNMKFTMNGALIIGTMDGANVEIAQEIGKENMFVFGADVHEVDRYRAQTDEYRKGRLDGRLRNAFRAIYEGKFGALNDDIKGYLNRIEAGSDHYCLSLDFASYVEAQERADRTYRDQALWNKMAIIGIAKSGKFSSDRTIQEYCAQIWKITPKRIPNPADKPQNRVRSFPNLTQLVQNK